MNDFCLSVMAGRRPGHPISPRSSTLGFGSPGLAAPLRPVMTEKKQMHAADGIKLLAFFVPDSRVLGTWRACLWRRVLDK
jgi:hypothetical protein